MDEQSLISVGRTQVGKIYEVYEDLVATDRRIRPKPPPEFMGVAIIRSHYGAFWTTGVNVDWLIDRGCGLQLKNDRDSRWFHRKWKFKPVEDLALYTDMTLTEKGKEMLEIL
jgi:hypothetical protein